MVTVPPPPLPADLANCETPPVNVPLRALDAGETARLWMTDRTALGKVNRCNKRLVKIYRGETEPLDLSIR